MDAVVAESDNDDESSSFKLHEHQTNKGNVNPRGLEAHAAVSRKVINSLHTTVVGHYT